MTKFSFRDSFTVNGQAIESFASWSTVYNYESLKIFSYLQKVTWISLKSGVQNGTWLQTVIVRVYLIIALTYIVELGSFYLADIARKQSFVFEIV